MTHLQPIDDVPLDRPPPPKRRKSNQSVPKSQKVTSVSHVHVHGIIVLTLIL